MDQASRAKWTSGGRYGWRRGAGFAGPVLEREEKPAWVRGIIIAGGGSMTAYGVLRTR